MERTTSAGEPKNQPARPVLVFGIVFNDLAPRDGFLNFLDADMPVSHLLAGVCGKAIIPAGHLLLDFGQTQGSYATSSGPASRPAMALAAATAGLTR